MWVFAYMLITCKTCKEDKWIDEFPKDKYKVFGIRTKCKSCTKIYLDNTKENRNKVKKEWLIRNPEKRKNYAVNYEIKNKEKRNLSRTEYREVNREILRVKDKEYKIKNAEQIKIRDSERRAKRTIESKNKRLEIRRLYLLSDEYKNKERARKDKQNAECKLKRESDALFRLKDNMRARTRKAFRHRFNKRHTSSELLGINYSELYAYIESLFTDGMSWNLLGSRIHIDHIIPLASATNEDELIKLCHYTNLQPLWAEYNLSKADKMPNEI